MNMHLYPSTCNPNKTHHEVLLALLTQGFKVLPQNKKKKTRLQEVIEAISEKLDRSINTAETLIILFLNILKTS